MMDQVERAGITVKRARNEKLERWNELVERSPQGTVFHQREALSVLADHAGATLHPLIGHKGQEPVGLFPIFEIAKGPVSAAFSPPPSLWISYLGPALLNVDGLKRRTLETRHQRFVEGCLEWVDGSIDPRYAHVATDHGYRDPRPFEWNEFDVTLRHSYVVDLTPDEEELLMSFSSDARRNVRNGADGNHEIREGGSDAIRGIVEQVRRRHEEQEIAYPVEPEFVVDLYRQLPDGQVRPYVCTVDGEYQGGLIALAYGDRIDRWQGGVRVDGCELPVNDLLDWRIMRDAMDDGIEQYDLVGANEERLCEYKGKFDPELVQYHSLERGTPVMQALSTVYKRIR